MIVGWHAMTTRDVDLVMVPLRMACGTEADAATLLSPDSSDVTRMREPTHIVCPDRVPRPRTDCALNRERRLRPQCINGLYKAECIRTTIFHEGLLQDHRRC